MQKEITKLLAGDYAVDDENVFVRFYKTDEGVQMVMMDLDLDIYYHFTFDSGKVIHFEIGSPSDFED